MSVAMPKYTLDEIKQIAFMGFDYKVPDEVMDKIARLAKEVGSPDYVKTPIFKKRENPMKVEPVSIQKEKHRKNKEVLNDEDWEALRSFQTTKMETKVGLDADFDAIRGIINKMTDKNCEEQKVKVVEVIEKIIAENPDTDLSNIGSNIFEIASSNRYYSKVYADLYATLSDKFEFIKTKYQENFERFTELFNDIEYVSPDVNYDRFCEINKINEKRKSLATFYVNLMGYGVIKKEEITNIMYNLLLKLYEYISIENKKNEVEELTETIAILYNKELYESNNTNLIDGLTINKVIEKIANSKVKDYKSLTNKALFKFMDLIDM